jgi:5-methylthioribose kinase
MDPVLDIYSTNSMQKVQSSCKKDIEMLVLDVRKNNTQNNRIKKMINYLNRVVDNIEHTFPEEYQKNWTIK